MTGAKSFLINSRRIRFLWLLLGYVGSRALVAAFGATDQSTLSVPQVMNEVSNADCVVPQFHIDDCSRHRLPTNLQILRTPIFLPQRRQWIQSSLASLGIVFGAAPECMALPTSTTTLPSHTSVPTANLMPSTTTTRTRTYKLQSGILLRDLRIGGGRLVTETVDTTYTTTTTTTTSDDDDAYKNSNNTNKPLVLLHLQILLRDGTILMDTRQDGRPILYQLGSSSLSMNGSANQPISKLIPPGIDDALVSRGTIVPSNDDDDDVDELRRKLDPMREGGIRLVVLPAYLGYGNEGLSRYQQLKFGDGHLRKPVPRDEVLRCEIEVLRCQPILLQETVGDKDSSSTSTAVRKGSGMTPLGCCPEDLYPCISP